MFCRLRVEMSAVAAALLLVACGPPPEEPPLLRIEVESSGEIVPWTALEPLDDPDRFHFAVVTDRTGGHRPGVFPLGLDKVNLLQPAFAVSVGDLIEGYTLSRTTLDEEWEELEGFVESLAMPFFYVPGNHDISNPLMLEIWEERFGHSYYHFRYKDVLFLVLNSELFLISRLERPELQQEQMAYIERALAENRDVRWTMVFLHQPFWEYPQLLAGTELIADWQVVEELLADRPHTVFAGHLHRYNLQPNHTHDRITLATTGGASYMRGLDYGEFDQVAWVTMTPDGPLIANVLLDGIHGKVLDVSARKRAEGIARALGESISLEPLLSEEPVFRSGSVAFTLRNTTEAQVVARARLESSPNLSAAPSSLQAELAPGEERRFVVELEASAPTPLVALAPVLASWQLGTELPDGKPLGQQLEFALVPERPFEIGPAPEGVSVDGDLSEWVELPLLGDAPGVGLGEGYQGPEDVSLRFAVAHDAHYLYLAVRVRDDELFAPADGYALHQDALSLGVDARPQPERDQPLTVNEAFLRGLAGPIILFAASPAESQGAEALFWGRAYLPEGSQVALRRADGGYSAEVAIPAAALDERQGKPWEAVRIGLTVYDADDEGRERLQYSWRPSRLSTGGRPGLDTFVRR